ncbi:MAG TPA: sigma factor-like helix-turn-helix DNA-binding protein, partial [Polyangia bacterium]
HFRAVAREPVRRSWDDASADNLGAGEDDDTLHRQVCACVRKTLDTVGPAYADVLRAVDLEDEPLAAYAARTGIAVGNARVRLHRARRSMRQRLEQLCGVRDAEAFLDCACGPAC